MPPIAVRPAPETRAAYPPGASREPGAPGSFFGAYPSLPYSNDYVTRLPAPLNRIEQTHLMPNMYQLSDGTIVSDQEVKRIYAEQKRRMQGARDPEPEGYVRSSDLLKDGYIPRAEQVVGRREPDVTCHPNGGWEIDPGFAGREERGRNDEAQVTRAPGLDYVVGNPGENLVKFDGCAVWDPRHQLLEAKGPGHEAVIDAGKAYGFVDRVARKAADQGDDRSSRLVGDRSTGMRLRSARGSSSRASFRSRGGSGLSIRSRGELAT